MTFVDFLNTVVGIVSLVLGGLAFWLSLYFYDKAKESEKNAALALEAIKAQTGALQTLTQRWMDRLTRYVTQPKEPDESVRLLITTVASYPGMILESLRGIALPAASTPNLPAPGATLEETVSCYLVIYYYSGLANLLAQQQLKDLAQIEESDPRRATISDIVEGTSADYRHMQTVVGKLSPELVNNSQHANLYQAAAGWNNAVRNKDQSFAAMAEEEPTA